MEIFELLNTVATTSLAALAIAAGTVALLGGVVVGVAVLARALSSRRTHEA